MSSEGRKLLTKCIVHRSADREEPSTRFLFPICTICVFRSSNPSHPFAISNYRDSARKPGEFDYLIISTRRRFRVEDGGKDASPGIQRYDLSVDWKKKKKKKGGINKVDRRANILRYPISQFATYRILRMQNVGEAIDVDDLATTIAELQFPCW